MLIFLKNSCLLILLYPLPSCNPSLLSPWKQKLTISKKLAQKLSWLSDLMNRDTQLLHACLLATFRTMGPPAVRGPLSQETRKILRSLKLLSPWLCSSPGFPIKLLYLVNTVKGGMPVPQIILKTDLQVKSLLNMQLWRPPGNSRFFTSSFCWQSHLFVSSSLHRLLFISKCSLCPCFCFWMS